MIVSADVVFIGCDEQNFKGKDGKDIQFQRVTFVPVGSKDSMTLTALKVLDFSAYDQFCNLSFSIDFFNDPRSGYLKGKIVAVS